jgi:hypothetical protein
VSPEGLMGKQPLRFTPFRAAAPLPHRVGTRSTAWPRGLGPAGWPSGAGTLAVRLRTLDRRTLPAAAAPGRWRALVWTGSFVAGMLSYVEQQRLAARFGSDAVY